MIIKLGDAAPDFKLPDQTGKTRSLADYKGKWILLYFYSKDDTPGCAKEACLIRDSFGEFKARDTVVLGVSADSVESHKKFAKKYTLPFPILADPEKKVINQYGLWQEKKFMGKKYFATARTSFLINPEGKIEKIYQNVKPRSHATEVLNDRAP